MSSAAAARAPHGVMSGAWGAPHLSSKRGVTCRVARACQACLRASRLLARASCRLQDRDGDGTLRKREFLITLKNLLGDEARWRETTRDVADEIWDLIDADGSGWCAGAPPARGQDRG